MGQDRGYMIHTVRNSPTRDMPRCLRKFRHPLVPVCLKKDPSSYFPIKKTFHIFTSELVSVHLNASYDSNVDRQLGCLCRVSTGPRLYLGRRPIYYPLSLSSTGLIYTTSCLARTDSLLCFPNHVGFRCACLPVLFPT